MAKMIDGYVTKDELYRLISNIKMNPDMVVDDKTCSAIVKAISDMPTADVQPVKHGRWESSQRTIETGTVYCSNCAIEYYISDLQTVGDCNGIVHYCPNCGARMDGATE